MLTILCRFLHNGARISQSAKTAKYSVESVDSVAEKFKLVGNFSEKIALKGTKKPPKPCLGGEQNCIIYF